MTRFSRLEKAAEQTEEGEQDKKNLLYFDTFVLDLTSKRVCAKAELYFGGKKKINLATSGGPWRQFYFLLR